MFRFKNGTGRKTTKCSTGGSNTMADIGGTKTCAYLQRECEVLLEGGPDSTALFQKCSKNPGHKKFIPIKDLRDEKHLPYLRSLGFKLETILNMADRTVRVVTNLTSNDRPDTFTGTTEPYPYSHLKGRSDTMRCGTGFITAVSFSKTSGSPCPCFPCRMTGAPEMDYYEVKVQTAAHVVFNTAEALDTVLECFYDSEDRESVMRLYGIRAYSSPDLDTCTVVCTTHNADLLARLLGLPIATLPCHYSDQNQGLIISHPHGKWKHVTIGACCTTRKFSSQEIVSYFEECENICFRFPGRSLTAWAKTLRIRRVFSQQLPSRGGSQYNVYVMPNCAEFCFPPNFDHDLKFKLCDGVFWSTMPKGFEVKLENGKTIRFPRNTEFALLDMSSYDGNYRVVYDTSTCPGSSGAPVLTKGPSDGKWAYRGFIHSGSCGGDGTNRSGYHALCEGQHGHSPQNDNNQKVVLLPEGNIQRALLIHKDKWKKKVRDKEK